MTSSSVIPMFAGSSRSDGLKTKAADPDPEADGRVGEGSECGLVLGGVLAQSLRR